jgi:hypothetical protein
LYQLKQKRTAGEEKLGSDEADHVARQRRRHEPKLQIRLLGATLIQPNAKAPARSEPPPVEPLNPAEPVQEGPSNQANPQGAGTTENGPDATPLNESKGLE